MTTPDAFAGRSLRFGANYVPSRGWFYSWLDFDADSVRRDFADLASLGLDHVRIFPIWPWIQPNRGLLRRAAIDDVLQTIDLAAEAGLDVAVDLIQGHLSSFDFLPSWVLTWHRASLFEDDRVRAGLVSYVETMSAAVASRPNVFAITLGNEVNNLWPSNATTAAASRDWAEELLRTARKAAPEVQVLLSLYDDTWYAADHPFHPADNVETGDLTTVHSWIFNGAARVDGPLGPATLAHADYLVELAAAASPRPHRPVWLQEIGAPRPELDDDTLAPFVTETVRLVTENPALWGITWWCSHDVGRALLDFPEREYDLGLFTVDHQRKPVADALATAIAAARASAPRPTRGAIVSPVDYVAEPARRDEIAPGSAFHRAWSAARAQAPVGIVLPHLADDVDYLRDRGITLI